MTFLLKIIFKSFPTKLSNTIYMHVKCIKSYTYIASLAKHFKVKNLIMGILNTFRNNYLDIFLN